MSWRTVGSPGSVGRICTFVPVLWLLTACGFAGGELPAEDAEPGHLVARALYADGGPQVDDARFVIELPDGENVAGPTGRSAFDLAPGTYRIIARTDRVEAAADVLVRPGEQMDVDVVLNAGVLDVTAALAEGVPTSDARFQVLSSERDIRGERELIAGPTGRTTFTLPAGSYLLRAVEDQASAEAEVTVNAGARTESTVVLGAGVLHAHAVEADGSPASGRIRWSILAAAENLRGERATIVSPTGRDQFVLPAGEYLLELRVDDGVRQVPVLIQAGERTDLEVETPVADT